MTKLEKRKEEMNDALPVAIVNEYINSAFYGGYGRISYPA